MQIQAGLGFIPSNRKEVLGKIILSVLILGTVAALCSRFPAQFGSGWYHQLRQPPFAPPYWLPFVMWTLVYILMGWSFGLIWHVAGKSKDPMVRKKARTGIFLFGVHLLFNLIFPIILIGLQRPRIAFVDMLILIVLIGILIRYFYPLNRTAAYLLIPYLLWILYAAALNLSIIILN